MKAWYDSDAGIVTGLQFNYVDSLSKKDPDKLVNGPAWIVQNSATSPKEGILDMDGDDFICGLTLFYVPIRSYRQFESTRARDYRRCSETLSHSRMVRIY